jgi:hypothetical protein
MSDYKLQIKDASGNIRELYTDSGSSGLVPYHAISGSVNTAMKASDLSSITSSISAVSSAVGLFNQQLFSALTGGPVSMSVDIVAGDVNAITGAIDKTTAEVAKLTALSGSDGLKVYTLTTASVNLVNTGSLTASIFNFPATQSVSFNSASLTASVNVSNFSDIEFPETQSVNITNETLDVVTSINYATNVSTGSISFSAGVGIAGDETCMSLVICNRTNDLTYIKLYPSGTVAPPLASSEEFTYVLETGETYEAIDLNSRLPHTINSPNSTSGKVIYTKTY